ncbi:MAG: hypothetical protein VX210_13135 [Myxococcota bacterium]|nr:hypothetical protein [Myxococcota bacterium]
MIARSIGAFGADLRDFVFPPGCHACDTPLGHRYQPQLCYHCTLSLIDLWYPQCSTCNEPPLSESCLCKSDPAPYDALFARALDDGPAAQLLRHAKDRHQPEVLRTIAQLMLEDQRVSPWLKRTHAMVAVPSTLPNRIRRGFDVGAEIAWHLSEYTGIPLIQNLLKRRSFESQRKKPSREDRVRTHAGFKLSSTRLRGVFCIVDDISVSTQTVREAALSLRKAGAEGVWVWTFSRRLHTKTTEALTKE